MGQENQMGQTSLFYPPAVYRFSSVMCSKVALGSRSDCADALAILHRFSWSRIGLANRLAIGAAFKVANAGILPRA